MDSSGSVGNSNFHQQVLFIKKVAESFTLGTSTAETRIAAIAYSTAPELEVDWQTDQDAFQDAADHMHHIGGGTSIGAALDFAEKTVFCSSDVNKFKYRECWQLENGNLQTKRSF